MDRKEFDERIKYMRVIKKSIIDSVDSFNKLDRKGPDFPMQSQQFVLEMDNYSERLNELAEGTYDPKFSE